MFPRFLAIIILTAFFSLCGRKRKKGPASEGTKQGAFLYLETDAYIRTSIHRGALNEIFCPWCPFAITCLSKSMPPYLFSL